MFSCLNFPGTTWLAHVHDDHLPLLKGRLSSLLRLHAGCWEVRVVIAGVDLRERACYLDVRLVAYVWRGGAGRRAVTSACTAVWWQQRRFVDRIYCTKKRTRENHKARRC